MSQVYPARAEVDFGRIQRGALIAGVVGLLLLVLGAFFGLDQFFRSYLWAYLFWLGLALGSFGLMLLQHLVGGRWAAVIRRLLETGALTIPLMALLFVPLAFGLESLYEWTHLDVVEADPILKHKQPYLNTGFFLVRAIIYFAIWIVLALLMNRWSARQDHEADPALPRRFRLISGPGLILYMLTMTFASFDWGMSLEPHWYSTIYGALFIMGQGLTTFAFVIIVMSRLWHRSPMAGVVTASHFHDLGNLMLAFTMLWAYMSISQFLIIWSGNLPEEVVWYTRRNTGSWGLLPPFLIIFHFALPFLLLLIRNNKRQPQILARIAMYVFVVHLVNLYWVIMPAFHPDGIHLSWMDAAAWIGIGGIWVAAFTWLLGRRPVLALHDHRLVEEAGDHGGH